ATLPRLRSPVRDRSSARRYIHKMPLRWRGREARQRPAKPSTRVQIPSPPRSTAGPHTRAIGAVVARFLDTEEVTGSNPVSPTSTDRPLTSRYAGQGPRLFRARAGYVQDGPRQEGTTMTTTDQTTAPPTLADSGDAAREVLWVA